MADAIRRAFAREPCWSARLKTGNPGFVENPREVAPIASSRWAAYERVHGPVIVAISGPSDDLRLHLAKR